MDDESEVWYCVEPITYRILHTGTFKSMTRKKFCHVMTKRTYDQIVEERAEMGITYRLN